MLKNNAGLTKYGLKTHIGGSINTCGQFFDFVLFVVFSDNGVFYVILGDDMFIFKENDETRYQATFKTLEKTKLRIEEELYKAQELSPTLH